MKAGQSSSATQYGTIPTPSVGGYISRAKEVGRELYAQRRPWAELVRRGAVGRHGSSPLGDSWGRPLSFSEALSRVRRNLGYFQVNYAMIVLGIVFLSLLWHPISLIVLIVLLVAWCFLYFFRTEPLMLLNHTLHEGLVLFLLSAVTFVALLLTHATLTFCIGLLVGVVLVLLHAVFRLSDDSFMVEQEEAAGGLLSVVDSPLPTSSSRV